MLYSTLGSLCLRSGWILNMKEKENIKIPTFFIIVASLDAQSFGVIHILVIKLDSPQARLQQCVYSLKEEDKNLKKEKCANSLDHSLVGTYQSEGTFSGCEAEVMWADTISLPSTQDRVGLWIFV